MLVLRLPAIVFLSIFLRLRELLDIVKAVFLLLAVGLADQEALVLIGGLELALVCLVMHEAVLVLLWLLARIGVLGNSVRLICYCGLVASVGRLFPRCLLLDVVLAPLHYQFRFREIRRGWRRSSDLGSGVLLFLSGVIGRVLSLVNGRLIHLRCVCILL